MKILEMANYNFKSLQYKIDPIIKLIQNSTADESHSTKFSSYIRPLDIKRKQDFSSARTETGHAMNYVK